MAQQFGMGTFKGPPDKYNSNTPLVTSVDGNVYNSIRQVE